MDSEPLSPELARRYRANVPRLLFLNGSWMFLVVMPVIVPFWRAHGLSMREIFELQAIFAVATLVLELPTGYVADVIGRRRALLVAAVFLGLGFSVLPLAERFLHFALFECLVAVAVSFFSGSDVALIYESLERLGRGEATTRVMGRKIFFGQVGETLASLAGGALALVSLELPFAVNAVTAWIPLLVALGLHEPERARLSRTAHRENFAHVRRSLFGRGRFLSLVILNLILYSAATLVAVWTFQAYWTEQGIGLAHFGVLWALYNLTVALTAVAAHRIEATLGFRAVVAAIGVLPVLGFLGMGTAGGAAGVVLGLAFQVCRGLNQVVLRDILNTRVPPEVRATANSVASLGMRLVFAVVGPVVGWGMDRAGIPATLVVLGVGFGVVGLAVCAPLVWGGRDAGAS